MPFYLQRSNNLDGTGEGYSVLSRGAILLEFGDFKTRWQSIVPTGSLCLGEKILSDVKGEFVSLTVGETYTVEGDSRVYDLLPKPTRKLKKPSIKLRVLVPPEMLKVASACLFWTATLVHRGSSFGRLSNEYQYPNLHLSKQSIRSSGSSQCRC